MAAEQDSGITLGWLHSGYLFRYPHIIVSTEHRRRLQYVQDVAQGIIGVTLTAACLACNAGRPDIRDSTEGDNGWRKVVTEPGPELSQLQVVSIRRAVGAIGLSQRGYLAVQTGRSPGNESTQLLLSAAAEVGFRDPRRLLGSCPVVDHVDGDYEQAPPKRGMPETYAENLIGIYGLLPDIEVAIQQAIDAAAIAGRPEVAGT